MPPLWQGWLLLLVGANLVAPLFFLGHLEAQVTIAALLISMTIMTVLTARFGFSRILGLGHIAWLPLLAFLVSRATQIPATDAFGLWLRAVILLDAISLGLDAVDVTRFLRGDRAETVPDLQPPFEAIRRRRSGSSSAICTSRWSASAPAPYGSIYPCVQNILLACRAVGLGASLTTIHHMFEQELAHHLGVPEDVAIVALLAMGFPLGSFGPVTRKPAEDLTHFDRWAIGTRKYGQKQPAGRLVARRPPAGPHEWGCLVLAALSESASVAPQVSLCSQFPEYED